MKIAVLGTGTVGRTIAARLAGLGHAVTTRDPQATLARTGADAMGNAPSPPGPQEMPALVLRVSLTPPPGLNSLSTPPTAAPPWMFWPRPDGEP